VNGTHNDEVITPHRISVDQVKRIKQIKQSSRGFFM